MTPHPVFELALRGLDKNNDGLVLSPAGRERLETALNNLTGTPLNEAVHALASLAYLLDKQGSGVAARALLGVTEAALTRPARTTRPVYGP